MKMKYYLVCLLIMVLSVGMVNASPIDKSHIIAAWLFDEGEGDFVKDWSGNGHDGRLKKAKWVEGKYGPALEFDGKSNVTISPDQFKGLESLTEHSISVWIYPYSYGGNDLGAILQTGWKWMFRFEGGYIGYTRAYDETPAHTKTKVKLVLNRWTHIAVTYSEKGDRKVRIYLDGKESPYIRQIASEGTIIAAPSPMEIGYRGMEDMEQGFNGKIDELVIFNKSLSSSEVEELYTKSAGEIMKISEKK